MTSLKTFPRDEQVPMSVQQIANRNRDVYEVERILSHRKRYIFTVKSVGDGKPTKEALADFKNHIYLHAYIRENNLTHSIPEEFQDWNCEEGAV